MHIQDGDEKRDSAEKRVCRGRDRLVATMAQEKVEGARAHKLSVFGRASVDMMNSIESPPAPVDLVRGTNLYKLVSAFLIIALLAMSSLYYNLQSSSGSQEEGLALKDVEIEALTARVEELSILTELSEIIEGEATLKIVSQQNLGYWYETSLYEYPMTRYQILVNPMENSIRVFYAPSDNLNLKIRLSMPLFAVCLSKPWGHSPVTGWTGVLR